MTTVRLPSDVECAWLNVKALRAMLGAGYNRAIEHKIVELEGFTEEQETVSDEYDDWPLLYRRIRAARNILARMGVTEQTDWGGWRLTRLGWQITEPDCYAWYRTEAEHYACYRQARNELSSRYAG